MITFVILVLTIFCCTVFGFPIFILGIFALLIAASVVVVIILLERHRRALIDRVTKAEIIEEIAVYKKTLEHSAFSIDFRCRSGRNHYKYKNSLDHYEYVFRVVYSDGSEDVIRCKRNSTLYDGLISKV